MAYESRNITREDDRENDRSFLAAKVGEHGKGSAVKMNFWLKGSNDSANHKSRIILGWGPFLTVSDRPRDRVLCENSISMQCHLWSAGKQHLCAYLRAMGYLRVCLGTGWLPK